jgi:predicted nucleotidyltransferase
MAPTPADTAQVARVIAVLDGVLGPAVAGAWLHGSWVRGGLRPRSDLDLLAVVTRPTTRAERGALVAGLLAVSGRAAGGRPVELTLVVRDAVCPWVYPPPLELQYGEWWRAELAAGEEPWASPSPDLAIVLAAAMEASEPLAGPPLSEVLVPVPATDLRRAVVDALPALARDLEGDEANVLLTYARIWVTLETGRILPKDEAAGWALGRLPPGARPALVHARGVYLGIAEDRWDDAAATAGCARALLHVIAGAADPGTGA